MAFRASTATQDQGLRTAMQSGQFVKLQAQGAVSILASNVNANQIFQMLDDIRSQLSVFNQVAAIPGIAAYAQAQFNDVSYNVAVEFTTMVNAVQSVTDWVVTNFPKDAQGFVQAHKINADGSRTPTVFTPAQTSGLVTALNAVIASVS